MLIKPAGVKMGNKERHYKYGIKGLHYYDGRLTLTVETPHKPIRLKCKDINDARELYEKTRGMTEAELIEEYWVRRDRTWARLTSPPEKAPKKKKTYIQKRDPDNPVLILKVTPLIKDFIVETTKESNKPRAELINELLETALNDKRLLLFLDTLHLIATEKERCRKIELEDKRRKARRAYKKKNKEKTRASERSRRKRRGNEIAAKNPESSKLIIELTNPNNYMRLAKKAIEERVRHPNAIKDWAGDPIEYHIKQKADARKLKRLTGIAFEVDHVIPLKACTTSTYGNTPLASGLHYKVNLEIITRIDNNRKNAYTWPDMWDYAESDLSELREIYETRIKDDTSNVAYSERAT